MGRSIILENASREEDVWLAELVAMDRPRGRALATGGTLDEWATGSLLAARQAYQDPATGWWIEPGAALGEAYFEASLRWRSGRLHRAGVRLARVLNEAMSPE